MPVVAQEPASERLNVHVRRAGSVEDYQAAVDLQKEVWGFVDPEDYASIPLMVVQNQYGGSVLLAEDGDGRVLGFAYALLCRAKDGSEFWWSHMTAVPENLRGRGVGLQLKTEQRAAALREGIREIRWTFDPLQAMNAYFNIRKLGAVATRYEENIYGISSSALHRRLPTDRLLVRWDLGSEQVSDRIEGAGSVILRDFDGIVRILEATPEGVPGTLQLDRPESPLLLEIPRELPEAHAATDGGARIWQEALRRGLPHYLGRGYAVTDFILLRSGQGARGAVAPRGGEGPARAFYVLERRRDRM